MDQVQLRLDEYVRRGDTGMLIRVRREDRTDITRAARVLGLSQAQFLRNVVVLAARTVIAEAKSEEIA